MECPGNTRRRRSLVNLAIIVFGLALTAPAAAQSALTGIVHDTAGQLAVGATVVVFVDATGQRWSTTTSTIGYYEIELPPGEYEVYASRGPLEYRGTARVLPHEKTAFDIDLQILRQERIDVQGADSRTAHRPARNITALGAMLAGDVLDAGPLMRGRTLQSVLPLVPGVLVTEATGTQAQITAVGQRRFANRLTIDGASADFAVNVGGPGIGDAGSRALPGFATSGGTQTLIPAAAIEDIQIQTAAVPAESAQSPGAQLAVISKAGGQRLTGAAFTELRLPQFAARDWFPSFSGEPGEPSVMATAAASLGGPLGHGVSFFGAVEHQHVNRPIRATITVPSLTARVAAPIAVQPVLNAFPAPTAAATPDDPTVAPSTQDIPIRSALSSVSLRVDAPLRSAHRLFVRANLGASRGDTLDPTLRIPAISFAHIEATRTGTITTGLTSMLSPAWVNELVVNVSAHRGTLDATPANALTGLAPDGASGDAWVRVNLLPGPGGALIAGRTGGAVQRQLQIRDSLIYARGDHEWHAGFELTDARARTEAARHRYTYTFTNLDQLLAGRVRQVTIEDAAPAGVRFTSAALFVQDVYRLGPRASLAYGLRYSIAPAPASDNDVSPTLIRFEGLPAVEALPKGSALWRTSWGNVAPRVAVTYRLSHDTALRAGWSLAFDDLTPPGATAFGRGYPYLQRTVSRPATFPAPDSALVMPAGSALAADYFAFPRDFRVPRTYAWHVGVDREWATEHRVNVAYIGTAARDLAYWYGILGPNAALAQTVQTFDNTARSDYHALSAQYTGHFSPRAQLTAAYTWSHAIDTDSGESLTPQPPPALVPSAQNRGSADFDRRHVLNVTASYRLPSPRWQAMRVVGANWRMDAVMVWRSGAPVSVTVSRSLEGLFYTVRPDVVPGVPVWIDDAASPTGRRTNPAAFVMPDAERQGTLGRNTLVGSALQQLDAALSRTLHINQRLSATLRVEAFNVLNHPNFGPPEGLLTANAFGRPHTTAANALGPGTLAQGGLISLQQPGAPRALQIRVRLGW